MRYKNYTDRELVHAADNHVPTKELVEELVEELANRFWDALNRLEQVETHGTNA